MTSPGSLDSPQGESQGQLATLPRVLAYAGFVALAVGVLTSGSTVAFGVSGIACGLLVFASLLAGLTDGVPSGASRCFANVLVLAFVLVGVGGGIATLIAS